MLSASRSRNNVADVLAAAQRAAVARVLAGDVDGSLCCALLPSHARDSVFAFRALNVELAAVVAAARGNNTAAALRLIFWRDVVRAAAGSDAGSIIIGGTVSAVRAHPLFGPLRAAFVSNGCSPRFAEILVDARAAALERGGEPPATLSEVEAIADGNVVPLLMLALESCGVRPALAGFEVAEAAATHAGRAIGLLNLLRALPCLSRAGECALPLELLTRHGIVPSDTFIAPVEVVHAPSGRTLEQWLTEIFSPHHTGSVTRGFERDVSRDADRDATAVASAVKSRVGVFHGGTSVAAVNTSLGALSLSRRVTVEELTADTAPPHSPPPLRAGTLRTIGSSATCRLPTSMPLPAPISAIAPSLNTLLPAGAPLHEFRVRKPAAAAEALRRVAADVLAAANAHVTAVRALNRTLPRTAIPALLPLVPADRAASEIAASGGDAFAQGLGYWSEAARGGGLGGLAWARARLRLALVRHVLFNTV